MKRTLDSATFDAIINALEAARNYTQSRVTAPRMYQPDPELLRIDLMTADALELIDREDEAA